MVTKGKIQIEIKAKDDASVKMAKIGRSADAMSAKFRTMGKVMFGVGLAMAAALGAAVISYAKMGDEVAKMAKRTGLAVEMLSELRHVAGLTGTDLSSVEKATKRMSKTIVDASEGMATYIRAFDRIGLSAEQLMRLSPEDQFWTIAKAIGSLGDATLRAATAQDIFGRAGTQLLPMMAESAEALDEMRQEAHDLGIVFDEEAAKKAEKFQDSLLKLKGSVQGLGIAVADVLVEDINKFIDSATEAIVKVKAWTEANPELVTNLKVLIAILIGAGGLIYAFTTIAKAIIAVNAALMIMHALAGPAGWIKLAAGLAIAAAAIFGMKELIGGGGAVTPLPIEELERQWSLPASPTTSTPRGGGASSVVNINVGNFMGDEASLRAFSRKVKEVIGQDTRRTSFSGINRLEYFPGSSAP